MNKTFEVRSVIDNDKKVADGLNYAEAMKLAQSYGYFQNGSPKAYIREIV